MSMPQDLVLIRHGQSEANVRQAASKKGDNRLFTDEFVTVPDRSWRLTEKGAAQAATAGNFLNKEFPQGFDRYILSPFIRTRETAACLNLPQADWEENRIVRERSWGEIDGLTVEDFEKLYPYNFMLKEKDPIYWSPPAGESLAAVAENRASNFLRSLSRESSGATVLTVSHGEFILTVRMMLEQWSDEQFQIMDNDPEQKIKNCSMFHYTRRNPENGKLYDRLRWVKLSSPIEERLSSGKILRRVEEGQWREFDSKSKLSNEELMGLVESQSRRLTEVDSLKAAITKPIPVLDVRKN